jgi:hypothetical protein
MGVSPSRTGGDQRMADMMFSRLPLDNVAAWLKRRNDDYSCIRDASLERP